MPRISVVMAVKDGASFLPAAVESVLAPSFADLELIVVDDGSTDMTPAILDRYAAADVRVVVHHQDTAGPATARNRAVAAARSPIIAILDADDLARPGRLERQLEFLDDHPGIGLVGGAAEFVDADGRVFATVPYPESDADIRARMASSSPFVHSAATMRREVFLDAGGYRPVFVAAHDLDLWLRIAERTGMANLPGAPVCAYRFHGGQLTASKLEVQAIGALAARASARARAAGEADPFGAGHEIDQAALLAAGVSPTELAEAFVTAAVWLARTMSKAGQPQVAWPILDRAADRAGGSPALRATVRRARAEVHQRAGHRVRAVAARLLPPFPRQ